MNDKFNDDDFSWLNDPDDPDKKDDSSKEADSFSWQQSGDSSKSSDQGGKHLGVTGQLSWLKGDDDTSDDPDSPPNREMTVKSEDEARQTVLDWLKHPCNCISPLTMACRSICRS